MDQNNHFQYFYNQAADIFTFYRISKLLFTDDRFSGVSTEAKDVDFRTVDVTEDAALTKRKEKARRTEEKERKKVERLERKRQKGARSWKIWKERLRH